MDFSFPELVHKPDVFDSEFPPVQVIQILRWCLKGETKLIGAQGLAVEASAPVQGVGAVFAVSQQRMPDGGHMRPDLMGASGKQLDFQQGEMVPLLQHLVAGGDGTGAFPRFPDHGDLVALFILFQITVQGILFFVQDTVDDTEIVFFNFPIFQLVVENAQGGGGFGGDHNAAGIAGRSG